MPEIESLVGLHTLTLLVVRHDPVMCVIFQLPSWVRPGDGSYLRPNHSP